MKCEYCNGTGETIIRVVHERTQIKKMASAPCVCLASVTVSREHRMLQHLEEVYTHPDKIDPRLVFLPQSLYKSPNLIITGKFDIFVLQVKAVLMKNRFLNPKPRMLFARSIDIVHDFHVAQDDGFSPHLSAVSAFDLVIVNFGTVEKNQALAPCMSQLITTRKEEKKPTWIYLPTGRPTLSLCEQENSADLEKAVAGFKSVDLGGASKSGSAKKSNNSVAGFSVAKSTGDTPEEPLEEPTEGEEEKTDSVELKEAEAAIQNIEAVGSKTPKKVKSVVKKSRSSAADFSVGN